MIPSAPLEFASPKPVRSLKYSLFKPNNEVYTRVDVLLVVVPLKTLSAKIEDDAFTEMPAVDDGVSLVPSKSQLEEPPPVALSTPFVTERLVPVMSVMTSKPILNELAARLVVVAFEIVASVPKSEPKKPVVAVRIEEKKFVDVAAVEVLIRELSASMVEEAPTQSPTVEEGARRVPLKSQFPCARVAPSNPSSVPVQSPVALSVRTPLEFCSPVPVRSEKYSELRPREEV